MTDTSKEAVEAIATRLDGWKRQFRSDGWLLFASQAQVDGRVIRGLAEERDALRAELDETKAENERLRKCLLACDGIFSRFGYAKNSVAREDISKALKGSSQ